jgi:hypothetical protein
MSSSHSPPNLQMSYAIQTFVGSSSSFIFEDHNGLCALALSIVDLGCSVIPHAYCSWHTSPSLWKGLRVGLFQGICMLY